MKFGGGVSLQRFKQGRPELIIGDWVTDGDFSGMRLENMAAKRSNATKELAVVPGQEYIVSARLVDGVGSIHCGVNSPYRDLLTTHALSPGNGIVRSITPGADTIYLQITTESLLIGAFSQWTISVK